MRETHAKCVKISLSLTVQMRDMRRIRGSAAVAPSMLKRKQTCWWNGSSPAGQLNRDSVSHHTMSSATQKRDARRAVIEGVGARLWTRPGLARRECCYSFQYPVSGVPPRTSRHAPRGFTWMLRRATPGRKLSQELPGRRSGNCSGLGGGWSRINSSVCVHHACVEEASAGSNASATGVAGTGFFLLCLTRAWNFANRGGRPKRFDSARAAELMLAQTPQE